jgi:hypothetical protein
MAAIVAAGGRSGKWISRPGKLLARPNPAGQHPYDGSLPFEEKEGAMASAPLSYLHGASQVPLLGETIGRNLDRTVAAFGDRDALISAHQGVRQTYAELRAAVAEVARGLLARDRAGRPGGISAG